VGRPDPRLAGATHALGLDMVSATPLVSAAPVTRRPRSFLIDTGDGTRVKIRFGRRAVIVDRAARLSAALGDARVPPPLARSGLVTAEAWVEGIDLASLRLGARHLDAAADLLASLHRFSGRPGEDLPRPRSTGSIHRHAERQLSDLVEAGLVTRAEGRSLRIILGRLPDRSPWGLIHGDFCGENLVWRADDTLVSVDHEMLGRGFIEYDMARTWYRWDLSATDWQRFERAYRAVSASAAPPGAELRAWRAAAATKGVHLRYRRGLVARRGLAALRDVLGAEPGP
jgi:aminoglycoside phosphotransferase (APT) family kinase protein